MRRYHIVEQCKIRTESEATTWPRFSSLGSTVEVEKGFFRLSTFCPFLLFSLAYGKYCGTRRHRLVLFTPSYIKCIFLHVFLVSSFFACVKFLNRVQEFSSSLSISFFFSLDLRHQHLSQRLRIPIQKLYHPSRHRKQWETAHSWRSKMWVAHHSLRPFHSHSLLALRLRLRVLLAETTNLIQTESEATSPYKKE